MFSALSTRTNPSALETTTSTSNSVPSTSTSSVSQVFKQKLLRKRLNETISSVAISTVKPKKKDFKMTPHKPKKSIPVPPTRYSG
ncbi:hypothetical protein TNCV_4193061 [Trichonephila clavipes]|nr:hypothetical protein TNCV_4193061 [Trichonephila clavipes]